MKYILLSGLFALSFFSTLSLAETAYRYPADLSEKERIVMMGSQGRYDDCLNKQSSEVIDKYNDFRQVADVAMEACKTTLADIDKKLEVMNLEPDFRRFFLRKTSQTSVKKLLPELMLKKSK